MYLLASDYDGTLYQNETVSEYDLNQIKRFRALGHRFGIATGRHLNSIGKEIEKFNIEVDFTIGNNGSAVLNHANEELYLADIERTLVLDVFNYVTTKLDEKFHFFAINNGYVYGQKDLANGENSFKSSDSVSIETVLNGNKVCALFGQLVDDCDGVKIADEINEAFNGQVLACPNGSFVDVVLPYDNKAKAIERVMETLDTSVKKVFTIGDSYNDVHMIEQFHGFGIATGEQTVIDISKNVVNSVGEAIEFILGK